MMAAFKNRLKEKLNDDRGSAIVLVIIAIAFVGTLVAMLVYMVYFNYLMKYTDRSAKNNFYTAETALDIIKAGLEQDVSDAMVAGYYDVVTNHSTESPENKQAAFEAEFLRYLCDVKLNVQTVNMGDGAARHQAIYDPAKFAAYWNIITRLGDSSYTDFKIAANVGDEGARMMTGAWDSGAYGNAATNDGADAVVKNGPSVIYNGDTVTFRNVKVSYTDASGYVSIVQTDIVVETPQVSFSTVLNMPELDSYSLVAAGGIYNGYGRSYAQSKPDVNGSQTETVVTGNVFGGEKGIFVHGIGGQISFEKKSTDPDTRSYTVTAGSMNALTGRNQLDASNRNPAAVPSIKVDENYEVWAKDLYVESATMNVAGNCFIQDDLTTDGSYSGVYLSGNYSGYGTTTGSAASNSSILINGAHTTLDFSQLKSLELAGHAYVGSIHYNANEDDARTGDYIADVEEYKKAHEKPEDGEQEEGSSSAGSGSAVTGSAGSAGNGDDEDDDRIASNERDILMGQSLAVKSDQIMYMVPVECMGYDGDTQILGKNPMTYNEYLKFATTYEPELNSEGNVVMEDGKIKYSDQLKYTVVRLDVVMNKVGGSMNSYGASYIPVFRRINGDVLVYFYISFASDDKANQFFRDYYQADKAAFDRYMKTYLDTYRISPSITANNSGKLSIAGNLLRMSGGNIIMVHDTFDNDLANYEAMLANRTQYAQYYQNLSKYLMKTTDDLAALQIRNDVFSNLTVEESKFNEQVSHGTFKTYKNTSDDIVALVVNNKGMGVFDFSTGNSALSGMNLSNIHLIIATGDVRVNVRNYDGLILCGGDIYIGSANERIDYDATEVQKAMAAKNNSSKYAFEVMQNGIAYANTLGTADVDLVTAVEQQKEDDIIRASDVVKFTNWIKE